VLQFDNVFKLETKIYAMSSMQNYDYIWHCPLTTRGVKYIKRC